MLSRRRLGIGDGLRNEKLQLIKAVGIIKPRSPTAHKYKDMTTQAILERIETLRADLPNRSAQDLVQRYITSGNCYALSEGDYVELKQTVAKNFGLHHSAVIVVGSAKLGFSIAPTKLFRHFSDESDIDIVVTSSELYDEFWKDVFDYRARGEYWAEFESFRRYHFRGWMRPDKLPTAPTFSKSQEWWDFFRKLSASGQFGPYKLAGALYKSWHFVECYHANCFSKATTTIGAV